jgi:hypothetical protein
MRGGGQRHDDHRQLRILSVLAEDLLSAVCPPGRVERRRTLRSLYGQNF